MAATPTTRARRYETITWAAGLLAETKRLTVFGTVHAPLFHPLIAAKQFVTADHIGEGRFGLNIVCGWNEGEFEMFGVAPCAITSARYEYGQEWLDAIKLDVVASRRLRLRRQFIKLQGRARQAQALWRHAAADDERRRLGDGQAFAIRNCDACSR